MRVTCTYSPARAAAAASLSLLLTATACTSSPSEPQDDPSTGPVTTTAKDRAEKKEALTDLAERSALGPNHPLDRAAASAAVAELLPDVTGDDAGFVSTDGAVSFTWEVNDREEQWPRAWRTLETVTVPEPTPHPELVKGYDPAYVHPDRYLLTFDACSSNGPDDTPIATYEWHLRLAGELVATRQNKRCQQQFLVPEEGTYEVVLQVVSEAGGRATLEASLHLEDLLVVSLGPAKK